MHQEQSPTPPRILSPGLPQQLEQIVLKVLAKEPAARYRTADQLGRVLETFLRGSGRQEEAEAGPIVLPEERTPYSSTLPYPTEAKGTVDWAAILLGLLAFLMVGGLIPLWLYACLQYPSCPLGPP